MTDPRIDRIERGIMTEYWLSEKIDQRSKTDVALMELRVWQELAERHNGVSREVCGCCGDYWPCPDRNAAEHAIDRLDKLWGTND